MRAYLDAARLYDSQDGIDKDMIGLELPYSFIDIGGSGTSSALWSIVESIRKCGIVYTTPVPYSNLNPVSEPVSGDWDFGDIDMEDMYAIEAPPSKKRRL